MINNQEEFMSWLDSQLIDNVPKEVIAFSINIYETPFSVEVVGSFEFDEDDSDWACNEDWFTNDRISEVSESLFGNFWESAEENVISFVKKYLQSQAPNVNVLKSSRAVAVGFVDGDLKIIK
ncbi:hypothetical protein ACWJJH_02970 [Endozoicomonadaceae bacterium StTr2]